MNPRTKPGALVLAQKIDVRFISTAPFIPPVRHPTQHFSEAQETDVAASWEQIGLWANSRLAREYREIAATLWETIQFIDSKQSGGKMGGHLYRD